MKAAVRHEYGPPDVLKVEEVQKPAPRDDEVLIRVHAASVNLGDWEILTADPLYITVLARIFGPKPRHDPISSNDGGAPARKSGLFRPKYKILGIDIAGRLQAVGRNVTQFRPGDEVFGDCSVAGFGAFAEYVCVPEKACLAPKPGRHDVRASVGLTTGRVPRPAGSSRQSAGSARADGVSLEALEV